MILNFVEVWIVEFSGHDISPNIDSRYTNLEQEYSFPVHIHCIGGKGLKITLIAQTGKRQTLLVYDTKTPVIMSN